VNGQDVDALIAAWTPEVGHDTDAGRRAHLARTFRVQLALHGIHAPYRVEVASPGAAARELVIEGEPVNYQFSEWPRPAPPAPAQPATPTAPTPPAELKTAFFNYRMIAPGIGYMDFFSLFDGLSTDTHFKDAVGTMFTRVAADRPRVLIIDIRNNSGGSDTAVSALLRHITLKPFRLIASSHVKRSTEAQEYFKSHIRIPFRWMGLHYLSSDVRQYFNGAAGSLAPPADRPLRALPRAEPFFDGPVCVLTGPFTFSAAGEFADAVKTYQLATIVGEETGGRPNDFGNQMPFVLPHSGLTLQIATMLGVRANGDAADPGAVTPDIVVRRTAEDIRTLVDPVLEMAKNCPSRSVQ
jgi:C-terminal processing protease CtpA/Prc